MIHSKLVTLKRFISGTFSRGAIPDSKITVQFFAAMAFASVCRVTRLSRMQTIFFHRLFTRFWPQMSSGNALSTTAILNETMASNTVETGEKIYEMRTYRIKPEAFGKKLTSCQVYSCPYNV